METEIRVGIVGCGEKTHGQAWAQILSSPEGKSKFGMIPARVWDEDRTVAQSLAETVGAVAVGDHRETGEQVDGVMITEAFPSRYLQLGRPFLEAGKRVFFNRPFAGSMQDAREIVSLAVRHGAKIYSASALFHTMAVQKARQVLSDIAPLRLFNLTGPTNNVAFYLPHPIACLVSTLGTGVTKVQATSLHLCAEDRHLATSPVVIYVEYGPDSEVGPARGVIQMIGPNSDWSGFVLKMFGANSEGEEVRFDVSYDLLLGTMARFFRTGVEPVPHSVILEKTAIFYAALDSAREGGSVVDVAAMLKDSGG